MAKTPLWSSTLDHICLETSQLDAMREFYTSALGLKETSITGDKWLLEGPSRRLLLSKGTAKKLSYTGFCAKDDARPDVCQGAARLRHHGAARRATHGGRRRRHAD